MEGEKLSISRGKYTDAEALAAAKGSLAFTDLSDVDTDYTDDGGKYVKVKATEDGLEFATPAGSGDMDKVTYDTNDDGKVDAADDADTVGGEAPAAFEDAGTAAGLIATHAGDDDAHHAKYTDAEAVTAMGAKADNNALNHDKYTLETHKTSHQNGGGDEISVAGLSGLLADDQHVLDAEVLAALNTALPEQTAIKLDAALSEDGKYCVTMALTGTAGEDVDFGEVVYFGTDSEWHLAKGDAEATVSPMTGIIIVAGLEDAAVTIAIMGEVRADAAFPTMTVGAPVFISAATAGDVTTTELTTGQYQKALGWAKTANVVVLTGNPDWVKVG